MALIHFSTKTIYNHSKWENNIPYTISFQTTSEEIPASNLTNEKDNSQQNIIANGFIRGIALHLPLNGYLEPTNAYGARNLSDGTIYEYNAIYYINRNAISLPREIGESVSGRLEHFEVPNQMILYYYQA